MDELETKLSMDPLCISLTREYIDYAASFLQLQEFQASEVAIIRGQEDLLTSREKLMQHILGMGIKARPQELSTYLLGIATYNYSQHERNLQQHQSAMQALEDISFEEAAMPSVLLYLTKQKYKLLVEKTSSGDFQL